MSDDAIKGFLDRAAAITSRRQIETQGAVDAAVASVPPATMLALTASVKLPASVDARLDAALEAEDEDGPVARVCRVAIENHAQMQAALDELEAAARKSWALAEPLVVAGGEIAVQALMNAAVERVERAAKR